MAKRTERPRTIEIPDREAELARIAAERKRRGLSRFRHDPYAYTMAAYPWGQPGTELENEKGPRKWQAQQLKRARDRLRAALKKGGASAARRVASLIMREAISSGHGIGKSSQVAFLAFWALDTMQDTMIVVTANSGKQLQTKTWPAISKWFRLNHSIKNRFTKYGESIQHNERDDTWRLDRITWSKENAEAFQGLHNKGKRVAVFFDEASGIDREIWEATEGAQTDEDTEILWFVYGNPTRKDGRFHDCFNVDRHLWETRQIDARTVPGTNKELFAEWIEKWGEDSDYVRIKVKGVFPRASMLQFIGTDLVESAASCEVPVIPPTKPLIMGIDVARGGDDMVVVRYRQGQNARDWPVVEVPGSEARDSMKVVALVADKADHLKPDAIFMDATGIGGPIGDRLRQLGYNVIDVQFGAASPDPKEANMRMHMWAKMREWLRTGGCIDDEPTLRADLEGPEYGHHGKNDQLILESKDDMKLRGLASPDHADALALTFAQPVADRQFDSKGRAIRHGGADHAETEYDVFRDE